jgi:hypothetical protein
MQVSGTFFFKNNVSEQKSYIYEMHNFDNKMEKSIKRLNAREEKGT